MGVGRARERDAQYRSSPYSPAKGLMNYVLHANPQPHPVKAMPLLFLFKQLRDAAGPDTGETQNKASFGLPGV